MNKRKLKNQTTPGELIMEEPNRSQRHLNIFTSLSYLIILLFFAGVLWTATVPWLFKYHNGHSSAHALTAGKHFAEDGFIMCKFLPILQPGKIYPLPSEYYTHYPPLCDLLSGAIRKIGFNSLLAFRLPHILAATLAALFWFLFIRKIYDSMAAFFCVFLLTILPEFFWYSYATYILSFDQLYRFGVIYLVSLLPIQGSEKKNNSYVFLWLLLFFQSLTSYEYIIYVYLFIWSYAFLFNLRDKKKLFWLFSAPVLGLTLHFLQNVWALGGISNAINDITHAYRIRSGANNPYYNLRFAITMATRKYFYILLAQRNIFKEIAFIIIISFSFYELKKHKKLIPFLRYLLLFFVCDFSWHIIFPQHAYIHTHAVRTMLASTTFLFGMLLYFNVKILLKRIKHPKKLSLIPPLLIVTILSLFYPYKIWSLSKTIKYNFTDNLREYHYRDLKKLLPEEAICFTNFGTDSCLIRYYLDRRTYHCKTFLQSKETIESKIKMFEKVPFFKKEYIFLVCDNKKIGKEEKLYLLDNYIMVTEYKEATIYKLKL